MNSEVTMTRIISKRKERVVDERYGSVDMGLRKGLQVLMTLNTYPDRFTCRHYQGEWRGLVAEDHETGKHHPGWHWHPPSVHLSERHCCMAPQVSWVKSGSPAMHREDEHSQSFLLFQHNETHCGWASLQCCPGLISSHKNLLKNNGTTQFF